MQTPGTLIIDGGQYESSEDKSTSLTIVRNKRRRLSLLRRRVTQSYYSAENLSPSSSPSELPSYVPSNLSNDFLYSWSDEFGFAGSEFSLLSENSGEGLIETADALFIQGDKQSSLLEVYKYTQ